MNYRPHMPVMVHEVTEVLVVNPSGTYLDATAGGGGHTAAILDRLDGRGRVVALDRDSDALETLQFRFINEPRVSVIAGNFRDIGRLKEVRGNAPYSGMLFDFGLSSHQIDEPRRGFSFQMDGPLDMRMDRFLQRTAAEVVNGLPLSELITVLREFGEVRSPGKVAERIIRARPLATTVELANVVSPGPRRDVKLLSQVFQAIRIEVNGELAAIDEALAASIDLLEIGGRLVTLSYHSLEDRRAKRFIRRESGEAVEERGVPVELRGQSRIRLRAVERRAREASDGETAVNPRARSARMRMAERVA
ncbi:MAG: 16S rRNA (cytosine(1402)-N(4))-methyltransferase RsmH [bacterium]